MRDVVLLLSFLVLPLSAGAADKRQDAPVSDTAVPYDLGVLVVTAARTEKPATVETITRSELETQGAVTVADALGKVPGVTVTAGPKDEAGVMVRGISSQRVLLMIDGRPINMPYYGSLDINSLQLDNVSRIQVTKGVPSLLYGVNGTGGVVNVVTSRPLDEGTYGIAATASGGEVRSQRVQAAVHTRREKIDLSGTLSRSVSGGY
ncbi:MAG: TonB-dependent receptor plug domain-containing protein, partial [Chitinispirillaceae bacterium]|nr:TonB-dependent receptor plug domain-containing protein [Chitinispirillaceae bacterium]